MSTDQFYEIYRRLPEAQKTPEQCQSLVCELSKLCRDIKMKSSLEESLLAADDCLYEIGESPTLFAAAISYWLSDDDDIELAKELKHKATVRHLQAKTAQAYDLSAIDESRASIAACRLCALHAAPAIALGWALSLAVSYPTSDSALKVSRQLLQHHINEYPLTTRRLLSSEASPFQALELARDGLEILEQQHSVLNQLPRLREFAMPPEMRLTFSSLKRSESRDIQRHAEEQSIFHQLVTKQHFKYANKTAVEFVIDDEVQETSLAMSSFQLSVELPVSELTDPISGAISRSKLWKGLPE